MDNNLVDVDQVKLKNGYFQIDLPKNANEIAENNGNAENSAELLYMTLKNLWQNFLNTPSHDTEVKEHWIHLFLFYFQFVDSGSDGVFQKSTEFQSFFNSIPEEICSFLLRHVYELTCESKIHQNASKIIEGETANLLLQENHNFSQLILITPADFPKVIALRNFLTDELGHHILEFLLKVDIKLIASQKGLCNLCIYLFPQCAWSDTEIVLESPTKSQEFVGQFKFLELKKFAKNLNNSTKRRSITRSKRLCNTKYSKVVKIAAAGDAVVEETNYYHNAPIISINYNSLSTINEQIYENFKTARKTSDEIGQILIKLLIKCAANECERQLSEHSMSMTLLKFALNKLNELGSDGINLDVKREINAKIIGCALLQLIELCLNNIFVDDANLLTMNFSYIFAKLENTFHLVRLVELKDSEISLLDCLLINGTIFLMLGIVHNLIVVKQRQRQEAKILANGNLLLFDLKTNQIISIFKACFQRLLLTFRSASAFSFHSMDALNAGIVLGIVAIIENVQHLECQHYGNGSSLDSTALISGLRSRHRHHRYAYRINQQQMHCHAKTAATTTDEVQQFPQLLSCFFQGLLLELQANLSKDLQLKNLRHWLRFGLCCCHYTLATVEQLLTWLLKKRQTANYQKQTFNFLQRKILHAIFVRQSGIEPQSKQTKRRSASSTILTASTNDVAMLAMPMPCNHCDGKLNSLEFRLGLLAKYRQFYESIRNVAADVIDETPPDATILILFLKHLKDIGPMLPNCIAVGILAEIVLPIFRHYKMKFFATAQSQLGQKSAALLIECLHIFVVYMRDISLLKAFYNEENIQHLEDLMPKPDLLCIVGELIKIGIDNWTFLGENAREQATLSRRLIELQLKSSDNAAQQLNVIFDSLQEKAKIFWLDDGCGIERATPPIIKPPIDVLRNVAQLWSLNDELLNSSAHFYNEFAKAYSIVNDEKIDGNQPDEHNNQVENSQSNIKKPKKTISNILKLNYNALKAFLLRHKESMHHKTKQTNQASQQLSTSATTTTTTSSKLDCCFDAEFETTIAAAITTATVPAPIFLSCDENSFSMLSDVDEQLPPTGTTSLKQILNNRNTTNFSSPTKTADNCLNESIVIFDIRNCRLPQQYKNDESNFEKAMTLDHTQIVTHDDREQYCTLTPTFNLSHKLNDNTPTTSPTTPMAATNITPTAISIDAANNTETVIGKVFRMFGSLLPLGGLSSFHLLTDFSEQAQNGRTTQSTPSSSSSSSPPEIASEHKAFYQPNSEYKKQLLKIFESTLSICIKGYQNEEEARMEKHLRKLKAIIQGNAFEYWQQYDEEPTRDNAVLQALEILLQIAELSKHNTQNATNSTAMTSSTLLINQKGDQEIAWSNAATDHGDDLKNKRRRRSGIVTTKSTKATSITSMPAHRASSRNELLEDFGANINVNVAGSESELDLSENDCDLSRGAGGDGVGIGDRIAPQPQQKQQHDEAGYEADGEIPEISDSDPISADLIGASSWHHHWQSPTSQFRTHFMHAGLCRLIVGIIIKLTQHCATSNPIGWCDNLAQLANRLYPIREALGGSLFLLQSFQPLLKCNDARLKDLQQSVLNLIKDLNTPEILCTYFNILNAKSPPVHIIIQHMHHVCVNDRLLKPHAFVELEFPLNLDGNCVSTGAPQIFKYYERIRDYHMLLQVVTPITRAPCVLPITNMKLWKNKEGFTISLWLQAKMKATTTTSTHTKKSPHSNNSQTVNTNTEDMRSLATEDASTRSHILSIGSNDIMLSVFLTNNMLLSFEISKPDDVFPTKPQNEEQTGTLANETTSEQAKKRSMRTKPKMSRTKSLSESGTQQEASTLQTHPYNDAEMPTSSSLRSAFKHTKFKLLNSFSNIIHGPHDGVGGMTAAIGMPISNKTYQDSDAVYMRHCRLLPNKWTHVCISVAELNATDCINLTLTIDGGLEQHHLTIPCRNLRHLIRTESIFQVLLLGDSTSSNATVTIKPNQTTNATNSSTASTSSSSASSTSSGQLDVCQPLRFAISNVMLFGKNLQTIDCLRILTAMGPDFVELTQCQVIERVPNLGFLNLAKMEKASFGNFAEYMRLLLETRQLTFSAQQPDRVLIYNESAPRSPNDMGISYAATVGRACGLTLYAVLQQNQLQTLQTATLLSGGLSTLLFLFARTVELTPQPLTQALALNILLNTALSDSLLYAEFLRQDYLNLIGYVIRTERCSKHVQLLRCIVNSACSQPLIQRKSGSESLIVNENTTAVVVYPHLIVFVLQRYSDWHRSGAQHSDVLDMLLHCILALTREKHPQRDFNMEQLNCAAGLFKALLNLCKVYIIESPSPVFISTNAAKSFVEIVSIFAAGSPATPSLMDEIMKLLLLLQKPNECFITHDRSKFYFLLSSQAPPTAREKAIAGAAAVNFVRAAAPFRRVNTIREGPGLAQAVVANKPKPDAAQTPVDAKLQARINRIRRINEMSLPPNKRALHAFTDNLESVANCSKLNRNALRLLYPNQLNDWRTKFKCVFTTVQMSKQYKNKILHKASHQTSPIKTQTTAGNVQFAPHHDSHAIMHRRIYASNITRRRSRIYSSAIFSNTSRELSTAPATNTSSEHFANENSTNRLNELSAESVRNSSSTASKRRSKSLVMSDFYSSHGIVTLQEGLFTLLKDFLFLLPDNAVDAVIKHYVKVEYLLTLANNRNCAVRAAIVRLLGALTKRLPTADLVSYSKNYYAHHLANQLSIHATDGQIFEACFEWIYGVYGGDIKSIIIASHSDIELRAQQRFGINSMLAVASNLTTNHVEYAELAFRLIEKIFTNGSDDPLLLLECGLLQCCIKALYKLYIKPTSTSGANMKTEAAIFHLLATVGKFSLKSVGHINIVWDIINMLAFFQEKQTANVVKGFRSIQSLLQMEWINMFFEKKINPKKIEPIKVIALESDNFTANKATSNLNLTSSTTSLSLSETKTRLGLIIDRCCQFFTVFDERYKPSENEIQLFELLVTYCISTNQRYNNFIAWGLEPSRPRSLRAFIVNKLWDCFKSDHQPNLICDGKMIKSHLWLCLQEDLEHPIENLKVLCDRLKIDENNSAWRLESELKRLETNRYTMSAKQKSMLEKTVYKFEPLAVACIESSMLMTRDVTESQNSERKIVMSHMKDYDETATFTKWVEIIRQMTHDGAPWHCKERAENSWELDDTEGPSRVHTRLRPCHLDIDKRFVMPEYDKEATAVVTKAEANVDESNDEVDNLDEHTESKTANTCNPSQQQAILNKTNVSESSSNLINNSDNIRPLDYLISNYDQQLNVSFNTQVLYNFPAKYLPVDGEIDGEIIIADHKLYFLATYRCKYFYVTCDISNISKIWKKRYRHQENALEIYLDSNQSLFFSLQNSNDWKKMCEIFYKKIVPQPDLTKILQITQQWREGLFTNWEYLITLNQIAGRTYNDLMQYPVFPWILSNYTTERLDLTNVENFRNLEKPIAIQHESNEQHYINNYAYLKNTVTNMGSIVLEPYHYSSHYSNSGTVLHFLVRVPPFTSYFLRYQDNNFDLPDRTFHALNTTWNLASRDSPTDVKELIPEFFCLPEMFENFERLNFGCRQNGERVDDVLLPPWCQRDARLFVLIHRQALECEVVRKNLHQWIDLIFGFKQTGDSAVDAINVFHPATYSTFMDAEILDPIERGAVETMIKTYGQMPRQLFKAPHPASESLNYCLVNDKPILATVTGLRWGVYVGSPQLPTPNCAAVHILTDAVTLLSLSNTNVVYGLPAKSCVIQGNEIDTYNIVTWGHEDRIVRIRALNSNKSYVRPKNLLHNSNFDEITACGTDPNSNQLWLGHRSGRITVYKCLSGDHHNSGGGGHNNGIGISQNSTKSREYVRVLRLSFNSAFRKIPTTEGQSNIVGNFGAMSSATPIAGTSAAATAAGVGGSTGAAQSNESFPFARETASDSADLSWMGPMTLIRHTDEITTITLSVEFKIAVSAGRDGIAVIWDLNNLNYVRTIQRPAEIHHSPVTLIAISPTLGDIVTVHTLPQAEDLKTMNESTASCNDEFVTRGTNNAATVGASVENSSRVDTFSMSGNGAAAANAATALPVADECFEVTEENLDDFVNVSINPHGRSMLRLHTVNARYVQHVLQDERILAVCYSYIKEGVGVNVIATAIEGGIVRFWSSWNLNLVNEIATETTNIKSITYTTHQHLVVLTKEAHIQVWETEGLYGNAPKFPQISYK